jgi:hypothetical protein
MFIETKYQHKFTNPFNIATVVDNVDPTNSYRIKIRINILHDALEDKDLPWAAKVDGSFLGFGGTSSVHSVPEKGTKVLVLFVNNEPNSILYLGALQSKSNTTPNSDNYYNTYGIYTQDGEFIGVDKIRNLMTAVWKGDLKLDVEGNITLGKGASHPVVHGDDLKTTLIELVGAFNSHTHTGNLGYSTAPITTPFVLGEFNSEKVKSA